ncbi:MAG: CsgG/HfaB family protein [Ketobacteraceae bacterium]|nr:CsgG/HfaB family protein [Ketobacteraceae bacterium]
MKPIVFVFPILFLCACATQTPAPTKVDSRYTEQEMREAQEATLKAREQEQLGLKRKIAIGRMTNETRYGRSLIRDEHNDTVGKQLTDMLSNALTESGNFMVFERPDIGRLKDEAALSGINLDVIGVDALIIGSLTEFGRKTVGETGFLSSTKRQVAEAKVEFRLVDTKTGQVFHTATGTGQATIEKGSIAGFGSTASYDATLNDKAIKQAISDAVDQFSQTLMQRQWHTYFLSREGDRFYIAGGESQGIKPGMTFAVETEGQVVKSKQTGFPIQLPGKKVATLRIASTFGDSPANEGAVATLQSGSLQGYELDKLVIVENK